MSSAADGANIMAKPIDTDDRQKWRGYLAEIESGAERAPLTEDLIKSHVAAWKGDLVNPENPAMQATIAEVRDKCVALKLPRGKVHLCYFWEIISADKVIRYWLDRKKIPVQGKPGDFRRPKAAIKARGIDNDSYAPALAERVRRQVAAVRLSEEVTVSGRLIEGAVCSVVINRYERNPVARARCIAHHGPSCVVCGFNFGAAYGPLAEGFIHVHHVKPLSEIGEEYEVDPVADLRPVCANCHAIIHLDGGCRHIEEARRLVDPRVLAFWASFAEQSPPAHRPRE
jgi:hypothetical protein